MGLDIDMPNSDLVDLGARWRNTLVGLSVGNKPNYFAVKHHPTRAWKTQHRVEIESMKNGFYLSIFKNYEEIQKILKVGPWFVNGHPLVLKRWSGDLHDLLENSNQSPFE